MHHVFSPVRTFIRLLKAAFKELGKNDPLRMAGATAFFTTFALPPILIIIIQALSLFFNPEQILGQLFKDLQATIGKESVLQIITVLKAFSNMAQNWTVTIGGFIFLLFVATTLFKVIRGSLNQLWKIKVQKKKTMVRAVWHRLQALGVILLAGVLFFAGLLTDSAQAAVSVYLSNAMPQVAPYINSAINHAISVVIVTAWFAILFKVLPDAHPRWSVAIAGALLTSILYSIGKIIIYRLLTHSNITTVYGGSGSFVLLLLFVFYFSLILYYGAAFTKVWAVHRRQPIQPNEYAMHYQLTKTDDEE